MMAAASSSELERNKKTVEGGLSLCCSCVQSSRTELGLGSASIRKTPNKAAALLFSRAREGGERAELCWVLREKKRVRRWEDVWAWLKAYQQSATLDVSPRVT